MFYVALNQLTNAYQELIKQDHALLSQIERTEEIIAELGRLSGLEEPTQDLRSLVVRLYDDRQTFYQLMQVLDKAIACYSSCEERICEEYDMSKLSYPRASTGFVNLEELSSWLS